MSVPVRGCLRAADTAERNNDSARALHVTTAGVPASAGASPRAGIEAADATVARARPYGARIGRVPHSFRRDGGRTRRPGWRQRRSHEVKTAASGPTENLLAQRRKD